MPSFRETSLKKEAASGYVSPLLHPNAKQLKASKSNASLVKRFAIGTKQKLVRRSSLYKLVFFLSVVGLSLCWLTNWLSPHESKGNSSYSNPSVRPKSHPMITQIKPPNEGLPQQSPGRADRERETRTPPVAQPNPDNPNAVVVVVGGGLAGCAAAIEAAERGARVIVLEKEPRLGGNSAKATSGINGWGTDAQVGEGIRDKGKYFERDTYLSGRNGHCQAGLVAMLSVKSADAVRWLTRWGIVLTRLTQLGGHRCKRTHRVPDREDGTPVPVGFTIMRGLETHLRGELQDLVKVETTARLSRLVYESVVLPTGERARVIRGVEYHRTTPNAGEEKFQVATNAVVLATGGFANDHTTTSLLHEYAPNLLNFPTTNGVWATGDGVKAARELGAELVDMDKVQLHPTGMINPKDPQAKTLFLGPEALRGSGGILLNKKGERFVNELGLRSVVSQAIIAQGDEYPNSQGRRFAYCVLNKDAMELFGKGALEFYWKKMGLFHFVENVHDLAELIGCEESTLLQTLRHYNDLSSSNGTCRLTGKNVFPCVLGPHGPFYVTHVTPSIHYTMGGCLISPSAEILRVDPTNPSGGPRPILGLFGAGEVTGGVHGGNRLGGNSLLECVVFGRIAGERAAQAALEVLPAQDPGSFRGNPATTSASWTRGRAQLLLPDGLTSGEVGTRPDRGYQLVITLPSPFHTSGLALLQPLVVRPASPGSGALPPFRGVPLTLPEELGTVSIPLPSPTPPGEAAPAWVYALQPGDEVELQAGPIEAPIHTLHNRLSQLNKESGTNLVIIAAAPERVNPMLQLLRASLLHPLREKLDNVRLLYATKEITEMSHLGILNDLCRERVECLFALDNPPPKWTEEVEMDESTVKTILSSAADPNQSIIVVLTQQAEKIKMLKQILMEKRFEEGISSFIIT
ncbi:unnamed protein product [Phytomonas sp. Hart1]|nr:unnamed protein product [Phytomonas sp. Hart1]|eukprot:CCW71935.1 unnamed protein product [Phytomonas sp. isolate Hart1]